MKQVLVLTLENLRDISLKFRDSLVIHGLHYDVGTNALLSDEAHQQNDEIFEVLGIEDKYGFCEKHYGYPPLGNRNVEGQFPLSKENDHEALKRVVVAFMKLSEG